MGRSSVVLALFNITGWNGLVLFGVQQMPAGRSAILAYTMPVWATLVSLMVLHEPLSRRKVVGLALGMAGMLVLLGDDLTAIAGRPFGALMILGAAIIWAIGTVLLRKFKPAVPQNTLTGWMMLVGWVPIAIPAPVLDPGWLAHIPQPFGDGVVRDPLQHLPSRARSRTGRGSRWRVRCRSRCRRCRRCRCRSSACSPE